MSLVLYYVMSKWGSNFNCSYISKSSLTYVPILSEIFLSTNFYLLANKAYFDKLWLTALFSIERWHRILKIDIYLIVYCYFIISQNELNSELQPPEQWVVQHVLGFSCKYLLVNYVYFEKKHIKILCSEIWGEVIFLVGPLSKLCVAPLPSILHSR